MIAIVVSEDQHLQQTLSELLKKLGYLHTLVTDSIDEADYFFRQEGKKIKLVFYESSPKHGIDAPLSRLIIQKEQLNLTTLIHISNHSRLSPFGTKNEDPLSRVDNELAKPFGIQQLKTTIQLGQRRRAKLRNIVLMLGKQTDADLVESMFTTDVHWKKILFAENFTDLKKHLDEQHFRIGGIMVDPKIHSPEILHYLNNFKKTTQGSLTPLAILSKNANETMPYREFANLYFDPQNSEWDDILSTLSNRIVFQGDVIDALQEARVHLKDQEVRKAKKALKAGLSLDPLRWELLEIAGKISELQGNGSKSIDQFKAALETNPCNPSIYLHLVKLLDDSEKKEIINLGKSFCPFHPQIKTWNAHESSS